MGEPEQVQGHRGPTVGLQSGWPRADALHLSASPTHEASSQLPFQSRELQTLHNLRKLFVQDLTARVKKVSLSCVNGAEKQRCQRGSFSGEVSLLKSRLVMLKH